MSFDTSWDVDKYKSEYECEEHWQFRRAFLVEHKNSYPEDRLVCLAQIFFNVEFLECKYPQQTMDLIESLSHGLANDLREKRKGKLQRTFVVASDAAVAKAKRIYQPSLTRQNINNNFTNFVKPHTSKIKVSTPYHPEYIVPGFMLVLGSTEDPFEILDRSCSFCSMPKPLVKFDKSNQPIIKADLYIDNKLVASGSGTTEKTARKDVTKIAYNYLKDICFTIQIKADEEKEIPVTKVNVGDDQPIESTNSSTSLISTTDATSIPDDDESRAKWSQENIGNKILKMMGWKEGHGLGKNAQGRVNPIEVVQLPKNLGLGNSKKPVGASARQKIMFALQREIKLHILEFVNSPKKRLTFSTEFTKDERQLIHMNCLKFGLKTKSYGRDENRYIVISKKQNSKEVYEELINNGLENDYYILIPPKIDSE